MGRPMRIHSFSGIGFGIVGSCIGSVERSELSKCCNNIRPSRHGRFDRRVTLGGFPSPGAIMVSVSRRLNTPTGPVIRINSAMGINRGVNRTTKFVDTPMRSDMDKAMITIRPHVRNAHKDRIVTIIVRSSKGGALRRSMRPRNRLSGLAPSRVVSVVHRTKVINVNNTNFPAYIGLGPTGPMSAVLLGKYRYRPLLATSREMLLRCTSSVVFNLGTILGAANTRGNVVIVRSGGPSTVRLVRGGITSVKGVRMFITGAGCPRNTRGALVGHIVKEVIPDNNLPTSINIIMSGVDAMGTVSSTVRAKVPLIRHITAMANRGVGGPKGFIVGVNADMERLVSCYNKFASSSILIGVNKPVVKFPLGALSMPVVGNSGNVVTIRPSRAGRRPYVGYKHYMSIYPVRLSPLCFIGCTGSRG